MNKEKDKLVNFIIEEKPNYISQGYEEDIFKTSWKKKIPLLLKGPTGCGKTRFIEYIAYKLAQPLITVSCHEDMTAADLTGRYLLQDGKTVWQDGPLTLAVRYGGICYLDEIVEARNDTTVVIHSLTDDRRILYLDRTGEVIQAHQDFMMVISYNPGYQNIRKELKESTKQRFSSISFSHPSPRIESEIIHTETGLNKKDSINLARIGEEIRNLKGYGLVEGASTRLLVYAGRLIMAGLSGWQACRHAVCETLTDDDEIFNSLTDIIRMYYQPDEGE